MHLLFPKIRGISRLGIFLHRVADAAGYFKVTVGASSIAKDFNRKKESLNFGVQSGSFKLE